MLARILKMWVSCKTKLEESSQHHDLMKLLLATHREHHLKLCDKEQELDDRWFDKVYQKIFAFKAFGT